MRQYLVVNRYRVWHTTRMDWSMLDDIDDPVQLREAAQALLSSMAATVQTTQRDHERACAEAMLTEAVARQRRGMNDRAISCATRIAC